MTEIKKINTFDEVKTKSSITERFLNFFLAQNIAIERARDFYSVDIFTPELFVKKHRIVATFITAISLFSIILLNQTLILHPDPNLDGLLRLVFLFVGFVLSILCYPYYLKAAVGLHLSILKNEKRAEIDKNYYTLLTIFTGFAKGQIPITEAIKMIAMSELKGIKEEFSKIYLAINIHGLDLKTAIVNVAISTPSIKLSDFLRGLANYIEERKDYSDFVESAIQRDNIYRKIEFAQYTEKMRNAGSIYTVLMTALATVALISVVSIEGSFNILYPIIAVYLGIPLSSAVIMVLVYIGNPAREGKKIKSKQASIICLYSALFGCLAGYFYFLNLSDLKVYVLAASLIIAIAGYIYSRNAVKWENKINLELDGFIAKLRAATELKSSILESIDTESQIGSTLKPYLMRGKVEPIGDSFLEASKKIPHPFLSSMMYVISAVLHKTRKMSDVFIALLYEYHRYLDLEKSRKSIYTTITTLLMVSYFIILICMGILKLQFIPMFTKVASTSGTSFNPDFIVNMATDSLILIASTAPLTLGLLSGDYKRCFTPMIFLLSLSLIFLIL